MKKKLTLRLLTAMLMILTAFAFMPFIAKDAHAADADAGDKEDFIVNINYGNITIKGGKISYYIYNESTHMLESKSQEIDGDWYDDNEIVITGKTPHPEAIELLKDPENNTTDTEDVQLPAHTVSVTGRVHYITLRNLNMAPDDSSDKTPYSPIALNSETDLEITLSGNNRIEGYLSPGVRVPTSSTLKIEGEKTTADATGNSNKLTVTTSGSDAAGIGGTGRSGFCGVITIDSGHVISTGSGGGAGIGGSTSGSGTININGGIVEATGGTDANTGAGAPGIGAGSSCSGGSVTIKGGDVTAISGRTAGTVSQTATRGIVAEKISSEGNTVVVTSTAGILRSPASATNTDVFNAFIWTDASKTTATVEGDALLSQEGTVLEATGEVVPAFDLGTGTLNIPEGSSVTLVDDHDYDANGATIGGKGYLIDNISGTTIVGYTELKSGEPRHAIPLNTNYNAAEYSSPYIKIIGKDTGHGYPIYDGEPKELEEDLINIAEKAGSNWLDRDNWNITVYDTDGYEVYNELDEDNNNIINADFYSITFTHKQNAYEPFTIRYAQILPKDFGDYMIEMESAFEFGQEITFSVIDDEVDKNDGILVEGEDFEVEFREVDEDGNVINDDLSTEYISEHVGLYQAVFKGLGNYTSDLDLKNGVTEDELVAYDFEVQPAALSSASTTVTLSGLNDCIYTGHPMFTINDNQLKKRITVNVNGRKLVLKDDCNVTFKNNSLTPESQYPDQNDHITYAGMVTVIIEAKSDNYTGYITEQFEIKRRQVKVESATAAYAPDGTLVPQRPYDGTNIVKIVDATLAMRQTQTSKEGIIPGDEEFVNIDYNGIDSDPTDDLTGTVSSANAGTYETVHLKDIKLEGTKALNYTVVESEADLQPAGFTEFHITRLAVRKPDITISEKLSEGAGDKFQCTVKVTNAPNDGAKYLYGILEKEGDADEVKWQSDNVFDRLESNTNYWFYCKVDDSEAAQLNMYPEKAGEFTVRQYKTSLIPQDPPEEFELEFTLDPSGESYTATIPIQEGAEYSFDGTNFNKSNTLRGVKANTSVTGYIRFPKTKTHAASDVVSSTDETPPLTVKTPVFSPENDAFYGSVKVSISCTTAGATIYYTTDGNYPTPSSNVYRAPFTITEDTEIRAVAVKNGMFDSEEAVIKYVYTEYEPQTEAKVSSGIKITNDLKDSPTYNKKDSITAALSRAITEDGGGYTYQNIAYYDLNVKISFDNGQKFVNATAENFPEEGVEITVPFPKDTGESTHDFRVAHMFSETSDRLGTTAGEIEKPEVAESAAGLTFTVNGCSPLAIGWVETDDGSAAGDEGEDENKDGDTNASAGEDADTLNAEGQTGSADGDAANAAGGANADGANGANADGTGTDGENADGEDADGQGGAGGVVDELVNAVTTGDYTNPYFWAAVAIVSLLLIIIIAVATRRRRA